MITHINWVHGSQLPVTQLQHGEVNCCFFFAIPLCRLLQTFVYFWTSPCHWLNWLHTLLPLVKAFTSVFLKWPQTISFLLKEGIEPSCFFKSFSRCVIISFGEQCNTVFVARFIGNYMFHFFVDKVMAVLSFHRLQFEREPLFEVQPHK